MVLFGWFMNRNSRSGALVPLTEAVTALLARRIVGKSFLAAANTIADLYEVTTEEILDLVRLEVDKRMTVRGRRGGGVIKW